MPLEDVTLQAPVCDRIYEALGRELLSDNDTEFYSWENRIADAVISRLRCRNR